MSVRATVYCGFVLLVFLGSLSAVPAAAQAGGDVGYFQINSAPSGAEVMFDGQYKGETPVTVEVYTTATPSHTISISKTGYITWTQTYDMNPAAGQTISVQADLQPQQSFGTVVVTSNPQGALVTLDGKQGQMAPWTYTGVSAGRHTVQAFLSGYQTYSEIISVPSGGTITVNARLYPLGNVGSMQVISSPPGADLYIDGVYRGQTAATIGNLEAGNHLVRLRLIGYQDWTDTVAVQGSKTTTLTATLTPVGQSDTGDIQVSSNPPGAAIYLDGNYEGTTHANNPIDLTGVAAGTHTIELQMTNYQDYTTMVEVAAGKTTVVAAVLKPDPQPSTATLEVTSNPSGAEVLLDNQIKGMTPVTLYSIESGQHVIELKLTGYQDYSTPVNLQPGQSSVVSADLTPELTPTEAVLPPITAFAAILFLAAILRKIK